MERQADLKDKVDKMAKEKLVADQEKAQLSERFEAAVDSFEQTRDECSVGEDSAEKDKERVDSITKALDEASAKLNFSRERVLTLQRTRVEVIPSKNFRACLMNNFESDAPKESGISIENGSGSFRHLQTAKFHQK